MNERDLESYREEVKADTPDMPVYPSKRQKKALLELLRAKQRLVNAQKAVIQAFKEEKND